MGWHGAIELRKHRWVRTATACTVSIVLCMLLLTWVLRLYQADLEVPFADAGDALIHSILVKSIIDNGWVWHNPFLGAPYGTQLLDFPFYDNLNLALMKLMAMFTSNYAVILNLFFLLTFPLTVLSSLLVLRSFKISFPSALLASLLFAFLSYHFQRGEAHLFLSAYFLVPPMAMVILWVWMGGSTRESQEPGSFSLTRRQIASAVVICALVGSALSYYAFFGGYLLCVAAVVSAIRFKRPARLAWGFGLAAVIFAVLIINTSPNWLYAMRHGLNTEVRERSPAEAEVYGLKMTHLLLPIGGHRLKFLRDIRDTYDRSTPPGEGRTASLGTVGDIGFIFLLGWLFCAPRGGTHAEIFSALAVLTVSAVLLGTVGGLGAIFNFIVSPEMRAYNRISVYIAFFSLFAAAQLLDAWKRWMGGGKIATYLWHGLLGVILCLGILDQTIPSFASDYDRTKSRYESEQDFVAQIEASVPSGAMIFQLPNVHFPETRPIEGMHEYDELKGYLHSRSLRWSGGAMRGRPEALWAERNGLDIGAEQADVGAEGNRRIDVQLPPQALNALAFAGFSGIYVDRYGFWDRGGSITSQLQSLLGEAPIVSKDRRLAFFNLSAFAQALRAKYTPEQWEAERRKVLALPSSE
jgi:hypothetical protein